MSCFESFLGKPCCFLIPLSADSVFKWYIFEFTFPWSVWILCSSILCSSVGGYTSGLSVSTRTTLFVALEVISDQLSLWRNSLFFFFLFGMMFFGFFFAKDGVEFPSILSLTDDPKDGTVFFCSVLLWFRRRMRISLSRCLFSSLTSAIFFIIISILFSALLSLVFSIPLISRPSFRCLVLLRRLILSDEWSLALWLVTWITPFPVDFIRLRVVILSSGSITNSSSIVWIVLFIRLKSFLYEFRFFLLDGTSL